jgi:hypothetical protein
MNKKLNLLCLITLGTLASCGDNASAPVSSLSTSQETLTSVSQAATSKSELAERIFNAYVDGTVKTPDTDNYGISGKESFTGKASSGSDFISGNFKTSHETTLNKDQTIGFCFGMENQTTADFSIKSGDTTNSYSYNLGGILEASDKTYLKEAGSGTENGVADDKLTFSSLYYAEEKVSDFFDFLGIKTVGGTKISGLNVKEDSKQEIYDFLEGKDSSYTSMFSYNCILNSDSSVSFGIKLKKAGLIALQAINFAKYANQVKDYLEKQTVSSLPDYLQNIAKDLTDVTFKTLKINIPYSSEVSLILQFDKNYLPLSYTGVFQISGSSIDVTYTKGSETASVDSSVSSQTNEKTFSGLLDAFDFEFSGNVNYGDEVKKVSMSDEVKNEVLTKGVDITEKIKSALSSK